MNLADYRALPGADLVARGTADLEAGRETAEAFLVAIGEPKLRSLGVDLPPIHIAEPEHRLYGLLAALHGDAAHGRYNALVRRLVRFERSLACANSWIANVSTA